MEGKTQEYVKISLETYNNFKEAEKKTQNTIKEGKQCAENIVKILQAVGYKHDESINIFTKPIKVESFTSSMGPTQIIIKNV